MQTYEVIAHINLHTFLFGIFKKDLFSVFIMGEGIIQIHYKNGCS